MTIEQAAGGTTTQPGGQADPGSTGGTGDPNATGAPAGESSTTQPGAGDKPGEGGAGEKKPADATYKFEAPEGVTFDEARLGEFTALAKELNLTQEAAQKLVSWEASRLQKQADSWLTTVKGWHEEITADKALGNDKLDQSTAVARKAIALGSPALRQFLNETGLGNHPELFRWAHTIGLKLSEDTHENGGRGGAPAPAFFEKSPELKA